MVIDTLMLIYKSVFTSNEGFVKVTAYRYLSDKT